MPSLPGLQQPLADGVVSLRLSAERDIPEVLIAYQDDPRLHLTLGEARPPSGAMLGRRAEEAEADRLAGRRLTVTVLEADSESCRGEVRVTEVDWEDGVAVLQLWLAPAVRGRGLARRAHALVTQWLSSSAGLRAECREGS